MASNKISDAVIRRLPGYYRYLYGLEEQGVERIPSQELGQRMGLTASQIRQDINCFGALGQQGYGYNVSELRQYIAGVLGLDRRYRVVIVGAGNIGRAVAAYPSFQKRGMNVVALFDVDPELVGQTLPNGAPILHAQGLKQYLGAHSCRVGIVATPGQVAQEAADMLVEGGVRAIWNFAPVDLKVPSHVVVNNVHLTDSLYVLLYKLNEKNLELGGAEEGE